MTHSVKFTETYFVKFTETYLVKFAETYPMKFTEMYPVKFTERYPVKFTELHCTIHRSDSVLGLPDSLLLLKFFQVMLSSYLSSNLNFKEVRQTFSLK